MSSPMSGAMAAARRRLGPDAGERAVIALAAKMLVPDNPLLMAIAKYGADAGAIAQTFGVSYALARYRLVSVGVTWV